MTTGTAVGCIPIVGTALGTTNGQFLATDASGNLKPSGYTASSFRASDWTPTCVECSCIANYLYAPDADGIKTDVYGNFKHKSANIDNVWKVANYAGTPVFSVFFEEGYVKAPIFCGCLKGNATSATSATNATNACIAECAGVACRAEIAGSACRAGVACRADCADIADIADSAGVTCAFGNVIATKNTTMRTWTVYSLRSSSYESVPQCDIAKAI